MYKKSATLMATAIASVGLLLAPAGIAHAIPAEGAPISPDAQYCDPVSNYNITSSVPHQLTGFGVAVSYDNQTPSVQDFTTSVTVTATVGISLSTSAGVDVDVVLGSVKANVTATATAQLSGSQTVSAHMTVRPGKVGTLTGAITRYQTYGRYTKLYTNCHYAINTAVTAYTPYGYTYTATGG